METLHTRSLILFGLLQCIVYKNSHETNITSKIKRNDTKPLDIDINFLINSRKLNNIRFAKHPGQHALLYLSPLLLPNASDIESNPGPRAPKYPCQVCYKAQPGNTEVQHVMTAVSGTMQNACICQLLYIMLLQVPTFHGTALLVACLTFHQVYSSLLW